MDVYRTAVTNPPTEFDITPRRRRNASEQGKELPFVYTQEEIDLMDKDDKAIEVGHDAVSVHNTEEKAIKEAKRFGGHRKSPYRHFLTIKGCT